ncbi:hypothetical protein PILCRDRAFT_827761 [Piloderma croceum F 1598]|uniref:Uncharacterized protein n=1 Tax=Piloderma croceum (strain F 1598) TaxID=765440 RepID=A0A0C3EQQ7_PILCF|nr:hypothetical protein PILCRDRAFT_827761 [Piloderma croceum F 1598]
MPLEALVRINFRTHLCTAELNDQWISEGQEEDCQGPLPVLMRNSGGLEPRFELEPFRTRLKFGPKFRNYENRI